MCKCFENDRSKINDSKPLAVTSVSRGYGTLCSLLYRFVRGSDVCGVALNEFRLAELRFVELRLAELRCVELRLIEVRFAELRLE